MIGSACARSGRRLVIAIAQMTAAAPPRLLGIPILLLPCGERDLTARGLTRLPGNRQDSTATVALSLDHANAMDRRPLHDLVRDLLAADQAAEHGVSAVEMRLVGVRQEELRSTGVLSGERHPERAAFVAVAVDLAPDLP